MRYKLFFIAVVLISIFSCGPNDEKTNLKPIDENDVKERMETVNKYLSRNENLEIEAYISRRKWKAISTASGIRYWVYEKGKGGAIKYNDKLKLNYVLSLINGQKCYDSSKDGFLYVNVGKYEVSGLNEVLLLMNKGDKAKIIIPSHLGYGLLGDQNMIPSIEIINE